VRALALGSDRGASALPAAPAADDASVLAAVPAGDGGGLGSRTSVTSSGSGARRGREAGARARSASAAAWTSTATATLGPSRRHCASLRVKTELIMQATTGPPPDVRTPMARGAAEGATHYGASFW
jgi:hypothetical protein